jgi:hypothetical protein
MSELIPNQIKLVVKAKNKINHCNIYFSLYFKGVNSNSLHISDLIRWDGKFVVFLRRGNLGLVSELGLLSWESFLNRWMKDDIIHRQYLIIFSLSLSSLTHSFFFWPHSLILAATTQNSNVVKPLQTSMIFKQTLNGYVIEDFFFFN